MPDVKAVTSTQEEAKAEVSSVLASATFARSPRMTRLLRYLCNKIFAGEADQIKEYSIAVDLLGRPTSFDPSEDAIARVEVHRLRKKLKEYYECEGFDRKLRVVIPAGSYVPAFVPADVPPAVAAAAPVPEHPPADSTGPSASPTATPTPLARVSKRYWVWIGLAIIAVAGLAAVRQIRTSSTPGTAPTANATAPESSSAQGSLQPAVDGEALRIRAGRTAGYRDSWGKLWGSDQFFAGGEKVEFPGQFVEGTPDPDLFRSARVGNFQYNIPLAPGTYELRLYFAEMQYGPGLPRGGGENSRVFHIIANNRRILSDLDVLSDIGGPHIANVRVFKDISAGADGILHLNFVSSAGQAMVSGIELVPSRPHRLNPVRILMGDSPYKDSSGQVWSGDNYWRGGRTNDHASPVHGVAGPELYAKERYGHFSYAIPVADGVYDLTLYFAETYWGPENPGGGGPGSRIFDVFCNGVALVRNLDVYSQAGGNRGYQMKFKGLKPNAQGKLNLQFVPVKNYASLCGIAVDDVTP